MNLPIKYRNFRAPIRIRCPIRGLVELDQRNEGLQRINKCIEDWIVLHNLRWSGLVEHHLGYFRVGVLLCRRNKAVEEAKAEEKCPEQDHRDAEGKCPRRCIAVTDEPTE